MRYFIERPMHDEIEKTLIIAKEKDLIEKIELGGLVYVCKNNIEDIGEYRCESFFSNATMEIEDAKGYLFLIAEDNLTEDELNFIQDGYLDLELMDMFQDWNFENMTEEEYEKLEEETEEKITKSIIGKMKKESYGADNLETYISYDYWDGSNLKEIPIQGYHHEVDWEEYTEEFSGMEEIDFREYNTGHYELYRLKDEKLILIDTSYYQGNLWTIIFVNNATIKTIDEALEYVVEKEIKHWDI